MREQEDTPLVPDARKIAVLRTNGIGDFTFALPALAALREAYPKAEIVLLAKRWLVGFLAGRPGPVDRVIAVPPSTGVNEVAGAIPDPNTLDEFFTHMRAERFDLALQLHGGGLHSNPFLRRLGARVTAGLRTPDAMPLDRWIPYVYYQREMLRYLEVVRLVGARATDPAPRLSVTEADLAESREVMPEAGAPIVVLHPGATDPQRRWPARYFAAVARALASDGFRIGVIGTPEDRELVSEVVERSHGTATDLAGRLSLGGTVGLLFRSILSICNDSGPRHLAEAVGTPTVGIYWCFNIVTAGPATTARHRPLVSWQVLCPICGMDLSRGHCDHTVSLVANIPVSEVLAAARDVLGQMQETSSR